MKQYITKLQATVRVLSNILDFMYNLQGKISLNAVLHCLIASALANLDIRKNQIHVLSLCQVAPSCKMYAHWIYMSVGNPPKKISYLEL